MSSRRVSTLMHFNILSVVIPTLFQTGGATTAVLPPSGEMAACAAFRGCLSAIHLCLHSFIRSDIGTECHTAQGPVRPSPNEEDSGSPLETSPAQRASPLSTPTRHGKRSNERHQGEDRQGVQD